MWDIAVLMPSCPTLLHAATSQVYNCMHGGRFSHPCRHRYLLTETTTRTTMSQQQDLKGKNAIVTGGGKVSHRLQANNLAPWPRRRCRYELGGGRIPCLRAPRYLPQRPAWPAHTQTCSSLTNSLQTRPWCPCYEDVLTAPEPRCPHRQQPCQARRQRRNSLQLGELQG